MGACSPSSSFSSQGGRGEEVVGGKMAAPERNNTRRLTFSINLLTRVWVLFKSEAWCSPPPRWAEPVAATFCLNLLPFIFVLSLRQTGLLDLSKKIIKMWVHVWRYFQNRSTCTHTWSCLVSSVYFLKVKMCFSNTSCRSFTLKALQQTTRACEEVLVSVRED